MDNIEKMAKLLQDLGTISYTQTQSINSILNLYERLIKRLDEQEADITLLYKKLKKKGVI